MICDDLLKIVPERYKGKIILALGSNLGNRMQNIRDAISEIGKIAKIEVNSVVFETEAITPNGAPDEWNAPFLNTVIVIDSGLTVYELLQEFKNIEMRLGRDLSAKRWAPRPIDIDILFYKSEEVNAADIIIPHKQIQNRAFVRSLLNFIGFKFVDRDVNDYIPLKSIPLEPKFVAVVNVTPDSFSDGGMFSCNDDVFKQIVEYNNVGADIIEIGGQSTRPGATQIDASEELSRIEEILDLMGGKDINIGVDTFYDNIAEIAIRKYGVKFISNVKGVFSLKTLRVMADYDVKMAILFNHGSPDMVDDWYKNTINIAKKNGIRDENIVLDVGVGFGKTPFESWGMKSIITKFKEYPHKIMVGHSRKSFLQKLAVTAPKERDIYTLAISDSLMKIGVDYLRVHNLQIHADFFSAKYAFGGFVA